LIEANSTLRPQKFVLKFLADKDAPKSSDFHWEDAFQNSKASDVDEMLKACPELLPKLLV
jgi:hypothetical protein